MSDNGRTNHGVYALSAALVLILAFFVAADWLIQPKQLVQKAETREGLPSGAWITATLWFGDRQAEYLLPEKRQLRVDGTSPAEAVLEALITGPTLPGRTETIPPGTRVLGVRLSGGVAYADFSKELRTNHWGGSSGEQMTVYSVVDSLTELPGITSVQFLIEGQKVESIAGHIDTTIPIARDPSLLSRP